MLRRIQRSFSARMLLYLALILSFSMLVSTSLAYMYFKQVMRRQILHDELSKLDQLVIRMESQIEDIISFANNISVDTALQDLLKANAFENEFQRLKNQRNIANRLVFYNTMREYVDSSIILDSEGLGYSSRGFQSSEFFRRKFSEPALQTYRRSNDDFFSQPYVSPDANILNEVICYQIPLRDLTAPVNQIGVLYLEIHTNFLTRPVEQYAAAYSDVILTGTRNHIHYQKCEAYTDWYPDLSTLPEIARIQSGYLISRKVNQSDWTVSVYITDGEINQRSQFVLIFFLLFFLLSLGLTLLILRPMLKKTVAPIVNLTKMMDSVHTGVSLENMMDTIHMENSPIDLYTGPKDEISVLYQGFSKMLQNVQRYVAEQKQYEKQKKEYEFALLLAQINPHYLYNVLNTVVYLAAAEKNTRIVEVVNAQIAILQENLKIGEQSIYTTLEDELIVVKSYIAIQKYRYPDKFQIYIDVDPAFMHCQIPKTVIQPLIENAIYHGLASQEDGGQIWIAVYRNGQKMHLSVKDNGQGMQEAILQKFIQGKSLYETQQNRPRIGIVNIQERLRFIYGDQARMTITSQEGAYTHVQITLPYVME